MVKFTTVILKWNKSDRLFTCTVIISISNVFKVLLL